MDVVITGVGVVTPLGLQNDKVWENVREGRSGITPIQNMDVTDYTTKFGGEVKNFEPLDHGTKREMNRMDRFTQFALAAGKSALVDSGLDLDSEDRTRIGAYIGTGIGGLHTIEQEVRKLIAKGPRRISPLMIPKLMTNAAAGTLTMHLGVHGPGMSCSSACASAANAIGEAYWALRQGKVDVIFAGGSEAAITPMGLGGFMQSKALSKRNDAPELASRPFDVNRDGFVMAEGAGVFVLETAEHARARGARIMGQIVGYGASSDAYHITLPEPEGRGASQSMRYALADAGLNPEQIDYINAHGTSTPAGDSVEARAICNVYGDHAKKLAISSSKSMLGHLLGASGAVESIICLWAMRDSICPPTINLDDPDPECLGLNYVPNIAQERALNTVMSNSFGFGGHNVSLIYKQYEG